MFTITHYRNRKVEKFLRPSIVMTIQINFDDTPDRIEPIEVGIRILDVVDIDEQEDSNGDTVYVVQLKVNEPDAADHERMGWERFNFKYVPARIKFKQFVKSCGHEATGDGVEPSELIGCQVKALVATRVYKDKDTGDDVQTTQVKKFLFDAE